jgi:hypothetical protein
MSETCPCGNPAIRFGLMGFQNDAMVQLSCVWPTRAEAEFGAIKMRADNPAWELQVVPMCKTAETNRAVLARQAVSHLN